MNPGEEFTGSDLDVAIMGACFIASLVALASIRPACDWVMGKIKRKR